MEADLLLQTYLKRLRLPAVAANYQRVAQEASQTNQSYERYLLALAEAEVQQREAQRRTPAHRSGPLPQPQDPRRLRLHRSSCPE